jgi:hypothetical protein
MTHPPHPETEPCLPHVCTHSLHVGHCPPFSTWTQPHPVTLLTGSGYFSSQTFSHINTPTFPTPVTLRTYPPMQMEQTQCSEMLAFKLQTLVNHPEESVLHIISYFCWSVYFLSLFKEFPWKCYSVFILHCTTCHSWWRSGWGTVIQTGRSRDQFPMT